MGDTQPAEPQQPIDDEDQTAQAATQQPQQSAQPPDDSGSKPGNMYNG